jgi:hypothetical protein
VLIVSNHVIRKALYEKASSLDNVELLARKAVLRFGNMFPPIKRAITRQLTETSL